jgi:DHA1 family inner membrane transport protein
VSRYERARAVATLAALSVGTFLYAASGDLPIGLLVHMSVDLEVSPSGVGLLVTGHGAVVVIASIPLALLSRRVPRRLLLTVLLLGFVVTTVVSALAASYWLVFAARMAGGLTHALFWAVVVPTAAGLFRPEVRGQVVAVVFAGSSIAVLLGVPAGTWVGEVAGWRSAFLALAAVGVLALLAVATLLPTTPPEDGHAARGAAPDAHRYGLLIVVAILATTGTFAAYTYVAPFLTDVSGFSLAATGPLLFVRGLASVLGIVAAGMLVDRRPWLAATVPVGLQAAALLGLFGWGDQPVAAVGLLALSGLSFAALTAALGTLVLESAPGRSDVAAAGASTAVNVGIAAGALVGGGLLPGFGARGVVLAGGILSLAALAAALAEPWLRSARRRRTVRTAPVVRHRPPRLRQPEQVLNHGKAL